MVKMKPRLISGEEIGATRIKLLRAGFSDDSPEMTDLFDKVRERDDYLWARYAGPQIIAHKGYWAAISLNGDVIILPTASAAMVEGAKRFGDGNFVHGRLAEFRGHDLSRC